MKKLFFLLTVMTISSINAIQAQEDKFQWLEEVENPKALEWVGEWNKKSLDVLKSQKNYPSIYNKNLEIYNSNGRCHWGLIGESYIAIDYIELYYKP